MESDMNEKVIRTSVNVYVSKTEQLKAYSPIVVALQSTLECKTGVTPKMILEEEKGLLRLISITIAEEIDKLKPAE